ncbi:hypothetical protein D3C76_857020 [compost metagenome]
MKLLNWQLAFEAYILGDSPAAKTVFQESLAGGPTLTIAKGLSIYHNAYRARMHEVLAEDFPVTAQWLGEERFAELAEGYLRANPSQSFTLRWLGQHLQAFVAHDPALAELVRLEWAFTLAFDAAPGVALTVQDMAGLSAEEWPVFKVALLPNVQWLGFRYNSLALWRAAKNQHPLPGSQLLDGEMDCIVWRNDLNCFYRSLDDVEAVALKGMVQNAWSFAELCLALSATHGVDAPLQAATWLKQWISDRLLVRKFV